MSPPASPSEAAACRHRVSVQSFLLLSRAYPKRVHSLTLVLCLTGNAGMRRWLAQIYSIQLCGRVSTV